MKRSALSPLAARTRARTPQRSRPAPRPAPTSPTRPRASLRTIAGVRTTRASYFNAVCAFLTPAR